MMIDKKRLAETVDRMQRAIERDMLDAVAWKYALANIVLDVRRMATALNLDMDEIVALGSEEE